MDIVSEIKTCKKNMQIVCKINKYLFQFFVGLRLKKKRIKKNTNQILKFH